MGGVGVRLKLLPRNLNNSTILIIDDNHADRLLYRRWLNSEEGVHYNIIEVGDAKKGFESFIQHNPDCIILDFKMYGMDGFQMMVEMKKDYPVIPPIIFVTGMHDKTLEQSVLQHGVFAYLNKNNLDQEQLSSVVQSALKR